MTKDGREVCETPTAWRKRRWELFVIASAGGGATCFKCGGRLEWASEEGYGNYEAHHALGTRGLGGSKREDRIFVPAISDTEVQEMRKKYPYMPMSPPGMKFNLLALCQECHKEDHDQGCAGEPQWGLFRSENP